MVAKDEPNRLLNPAFHSAEFRLEGCRLCNIAAHENAVGLCLLDAVTKARALGRIEEIEVDVSNPCELHHYSQGEIVSSSMPLAKSKSILNLWIDRVKKVHRLTRCDNFN